MMNDATATLITVAAKISYSLFLRSILKKAVDNPNTDWDEKAMRMLDVIMGYNE